MDLTFPIADGVFNVRVCAVFLHEKKLLAMRDERSPYYYLPGGRVQLYESFEDAMRRELREELELNATLVRPLWLLQSLFVEDVQKKRFHELCLYYLAEPDETLLKRGESFLHQERTHTQRFVWLPLDRLKDEYFYPLFLKEEIFHLPEQLQLLFMEE